jgi:hypothetical protein
MAFATEPEPPPPPTRIALSCVEQPGKQVTFDGAGQVNYTEVAPASQEPITLSVIKTEPGEAYDIEPARIQSSATWLVREHALWLRENQVAADNGRLRIDLVENRIHITDATADGNARFRRFDCERLAEEQTDNPTAE